MNNPEIPLVLYNNKEEWLEDIKTRMAKVGLGFEYSIKPIREITTKSGKVIRCSANHIFPTNTVMKSIDMGLAVGDKLLIKDSNTYTI